MTKTCFNCGRDDDPDVAENLRAQLAAAEAERDRYLTRAVVAEARARWIPVGERMPDPHIPVLGWAHTRVSYCVWHPNLWISYGYGAPISVTHWMPLPHPPKETP